MFTFLRHHALLIFTLLAMLSQGTFANASTMEVKQSHKVMTLITHNDTIMAMQTEARCHTEQANTDDCTDSSHCDENMQKSMLTVVGQHCCDGNGSCQTDCDHCMVISITATLFNFQSWSGFTPSECVLITQIPHFHSITLPQDIKPPIA